MTDPTRRLIQNLGPTLQRFSDEQLYHLAVGLRHELARRRRDTTPEADALVAALLADARAEHRRIFSADCSPELCPHRAPTAACVVCAPFVAEPAEKS